MNDTIIQCKLIHFLKTYLWTNGIKNDRFFFFRGSIFTRTGGLVRESPPKSPKN